MFLAKPTVDAVVAAAASVPVHAHAPALAPALAQAAAATATVAEHLDAAMNFVSVGARLVTQVAMKMWDRHVLLSMPSGQMSSSAGSAGKASGGLPIPKPKMVRQAER